MAYERVTLYGVPLVAGRKVNYGRIDPELSRELFIRHALVEGDWQTHHQFFHDNRALLDEVEELEHRARRRDILVDDETLFDFYDAADPRRRRLRRGTSTPGGSRPAATSPTCSTFDQAMLINETAGAVTEDGLPGRLARRAS